MKLSIIFGHFKTGVETLYSTKWRNLWTVLGIVIGVASVIVVIAIGEGIKQQINQQINVIAKNNLVIQPGIINNNSSSSNSSVFNSFDGLSLVGSLNNADVQIATQTTGIRKVSPVSIINDKVIGQNGLYKSGVVVGTTNYLPQLLNLSIAYGQFNFDQNGSMNSVILGEYAAAKLFNEDVPLGGTVLIGGQSFVVEGILNPVANVPLSNPINFNNALFINYSTAQNLTSNNALIYEIFAQVSHPGIINQTKKLLQKNLDSSNGGQKIITVSSVTQSAAHSRQILALLTKLIAGVAGISLLVGGVGIMNVMLVSVAERTHEIGIRKAIGASNRQIISQFIIEASILSLVGGLLGVVLAYVIDAGLILITSIRPAISLKIILISCLVSVMIGVVFGSIPALKAARKIPIDALRSI